MILFWKGFMSGRRLPAIQDSNNPLAVELESEND
jgi:hypothetical protein